MILFLSFTEDLQWSLKSTVDLLGSLGSLGWMEALPLIGDKLSPLRSIEDILLPVEHLLSSPWLQGYIRRGIVMSQSVS